MLNSYCVKSLLSFFVSSYIFTKCFLAIFIEIKKVYKEKIQISLVIGGCNIFRGTDAVSVGIERTTADYMGMLGTLINALAIQNALEKNLVPTRVLSSIPVPAVCESYIRRKAINHLEKNTTKSSYKKTSST